MTIAIDLSPLQGPHRLRGVGSVIINILNNISASDKKKHNFVFFMDHTDKPGEALKDIDLSDFNYQIREKPSLNYKTSKLPGKLRLIKKIMHKLILLYRFWRGLKGYDDTGIDVYLHTDQLQIMPRMQVKKYFIAYDLIPYILEKDYLWSYKTARRLGIGLVGWLAAAVNRQTYIVKIKINSKKAYKLLAISNQTKNDYVTYAGVSSKKIELWPLGVNASRHHAEPPTQKYVETSWGYFAREFEFNTSKPFILYVGGTDARRKLDDLVTAFNHLRAEGYNMQLVFVGDILGGPNNLPVKESRVALLNSSYKDDILYLGFATEPIKNWLFEHAMAFVYPSKYEGFGLPVLEAMALGSPVITYNNTAITEVAGKAAIYANDALSIKRAIETLITDKSAANNYVARGLKQASKFTWDLTTKNLIEMMTS